MEAEALRRDGYISPSMTTFVKNGFWSAYWTEMSQLSELIDCDKVTEKDLRSICLTRYWERWLSHPGNDKSWRFAALLIVRGFHSTCSIFKGVGHRDYYKKSHDKDLSLATMFRENKIDVVMEDFESDDTLLRYDDALRQGKFHLLSPNHGCHPCGFDMNNT